MAKFATSGPTPDQQPSLTDTYFKHTRHIVQAHGDCEVTYAVFMRRPVTFAGRLAMGLDHRNGGGAAGRIKN